MTYDTKCHDLALHFLSDYGPLGIAARQMLADQLAQRVQQAVEDFLDEHFQEVA